MVQRKQIAKGSRLLLAAAPSGTLTVFGRVEKGNLPVEEWDTIEAPELNPVDDTGASVTTDQKELGDEILDAFPVTFYYDPRDTDAMQLDTWFNAKTTVIFAVDSPHATNAGRITCQCKIVKLEPGELAKKNFWMRTVTFQRISSVTKAAKP